MNPTGQAIRFSPLVALLAAVALSPPARADTYWQAGRLKGILDGWGHKHVSAEGYYGKLYVSTNDEYISITCRYDFGDQSCFQKASCNFTMSVYRNGTRLRSTQWGYGTGIWDTRSYCGTKIIQVPVGRLSPGWNPLKVYLTVRLNGRERTDWASLYVYVR